MWNTLIPFGMIQLPETKPWFAWRSWECHVSRGCCTVVSSKSVFFRTCDISHEIPHQVTFPWGQHAVYAVVSKPVPMLMSMPSPGSLHRLTAWSDLSSVLSLRPVTTGLCLSPVSITGLSPHQSHPRELPDSLGSGLPFRTAAACWG